MRYYHWASRDARQPNNQGDYIMNENFLSQVLEALNAQNDAYIKREPSPVLNKKGINPAIASGMKLWAKMSDATRAAIEKGAQRCNVDLIAGMRDATNVYVAKRCASLSDFVWGSGDIAALARGGSAKTAVLECCAVAVGKQSRAAVFYAATYVKREGSDEVSNPAFMRKLHKLSGGAVKVGTESTQNSVTFSKGGLAEIFGMVTRTGRGDTTVYTVNEESLALRDLIDRINRTSEGAIEIAVTKGTK